MSQDARRELESWLAAAQREIARLERRHALESGYDPLSGLVDLRTFCSATEIELGRASRHGRDVALALIDLDGMGEINERHGREAGDEVIAETGRVLQSFLRGVSSWNDRVQSFLFRPNHLAPTFSEAQVVKPPRFNAHYEIEDVKPVDGATWKLELAGLIGDKRPWTA